jgi:hypothetical protein
MSAPWHSRRIAAECALALIKALPKVEVENTRLMGEAKRIIQRISTTSDKRKLPIGVVDRASCLARDLSFCSDMCAHVAKNFFQNQRPDDTVPMFLMGSVDFDALNAIVIHWRFRDALVKARSNAKRASKDVLSAFKLLLYTNSDAAYRYVGEAVLAGGV